MTQKLTANHIFVLVGTTLSIFTYMSLGLGVLSLYVVPMIEEFGANRAEISALFTFDALTSIPFSLFAFKVFKKVKMKTLYIVGGIASACGLIIMSSSNSLPVLYIGAFILGFGVFGNGYLVGGAIIAQWYEKARATAMGIMSAASGAGTLIFSPIVATWLGNVGWRSSLMYSAVIVGVAVVFSGVFLIKESPGVYGLKSYGQPLDTISKEQEATSATASAIDIPGISLSEAKKRATFYIVIACGLFITIVSQGMATQQSAMIIDKGFSLTEAAYVLSVYSLTNMLNKLAAGVITDKFGLKAFIWYCGMAFIAAALVMLFCSSYGAMIVFAILVSMWLAVVGSFTMLVNTFLYERKEIGAIQGFTQVAQSLGAMIGPTVASGLYVISGSYRLFLMMSIVMVVVLLVINTSILNPKNSYYVFYRKATRR